jgi:hypothetical protein
MPNNTKVAVQRLRQSAMRRVLYGVDVGKRATSCAQPMTVATSLMVPVALDAADGDNLRLGCDLGLQVRHVERTGDGSTCHTHDDTSLFLQSEPRRDVRIVV